MRLACFSVTILLALSSSALAQSPATTGDTIGHPPIVGSPPPIAEPSSTAQPATSTSTPRASEPSSKSDTYTPAELPQVYVGPGRDVVGPDGSTKTVKAVPCSTAARETDGFTTCVGIPDKSPERRRR
jgi:hypothetical protein